MLMVVWDGNLMHMDIHRNAIMNGIVLVGVVTHNDVDSFDVWCLISIFVTGRLSKPLPVGAIILLIIIVHARPPTDVLSITTLSQPYLRSFDINDLHHHNTYPL
jgi:hypothetical protein